jgi:hypothetical protein
VRTLVQSDNFFYVLTYYDVMCHFLRTATRVTSDIKTRRLSTRSSQQRPSLLFISSSATFREPYNTSNNQPSLLPSYIFHFKRTLQYKRQSIRHSGEPGHEAPCSYEAKKSCRLHRLADPEVARMPRVLPGISDLHPHASLGNALSVRG